jgi:hypothetical protein
MAESCECSKKRQKDFCGGKSMAGCALARHTDKSSLGDNDCGYHRRDEELADKKAILGK